MRKQNETKRHGSRGMTLVELLVVMAILSVVMLAVMSLYVPVHQSTVAQTQVSDVQSNLRLATKTMTRDLLLAGFLMPYDPVIFPDATPAGDFHLETLTNPGFDVADPGSFDPHNFILRTRVVGNDFARISSAVDSGTYYRLTVVDPEMIRSDDNVVKFPVGSKVRLFDPVSGSEILSDSTNPAVTDLTRVYTVLNPLGTNTIDITEGYLLDVPDETVMIRIKNATTPPLQTIQYILEDGALKRIVNGRVQILARNVDTDTPALLSQYPSRFSYDVTDQGDINSVHIKLTGKTRALKDDAISGEKVREVVTSVKLRNVN